jgi:hypothetical protein
MFIIAALIIGIVCGTGTFFGFKRKNSRVLGATHAKMSGFGYSNAQKEVNNR